MIRLDGDVRGTERFLATSTALKHYDPELRKEFNREIRRAVRPLSRATRAEALRRLPRRGGLNRVVARASQRIRIRTGRDPGITLGVVYRRGEAAAATNRGTVRHPVFGNRQTWVTQSVTSGWFDDVVTDQGPRIVRPAVERVIDDVLTILARRVGPGGR